MVTNSFFLFERLTTLFGHTLFVVLRPRRSKLSFRVIDLKLGPGLTSMTELY